MWENTAALQDLKNNQLKKLDKIKLHLIEWSKLLLRENIQDIHGRINKET
jgi:hypothetical protein